MPGRVVRRADQFLALQFDLPRSIERDLLISKLFTRGVNTATEAGTAHAATIAILGSIVKVGTGNTQNENKTEPSAAVEKLAAESLVIQPSPHRRRLAEIGAERQSFAA